VAGFDPRQGYLLRMRKRWQSGSLVMRLRCVWIDSMNLKAWLIDLIPDPSSVDEDATDGSVVVRHHLRLQSTQLNGPTKHGFTICLAVRGRMSESGGRVVADIEATFALDEITVAIPPVQLDISSERSTQDMRAVLSAAFTSWFAGNLARFSAVCIRHLGGESVGNVAT
jgi:hypothetical protein